MAIASIHQSSITISTRYQVPWDIGTGTWRLDVVRNDMSERRLGEDMLRFCKREDSVFQALVLNDSGRSDQDVHVCNIVRDCLCSDSAIYDTAARTSLVEGPPGTGKSHTAAAIVFFLKPEDHRTECSRSSLNQMFGL